MIWSFSLYGVEIYISSVYARGFLTFILITNVIYWPAHTSHVVQPWTHASKWSQNDCAHMKTHTIMHNQFSWLAVVTDQLLPLSCGQLVHNRAVSCTNVYLNTLHTILPSWVGRPPLFIAVYSLIHVSVYSVSDYLCVHRMLCMSL